MTWRSQSIPPVPEATAAAVKAAFPKGNVYVDLHEEFGAMYRDDLFADFYCERGHPVEIAPWRLAMATVMQYMEGLTDRQTADAVRRCMDWKYALSLELTDPGFDFTLLHDFRQRLLSHDGAQLMLDTLLDTCKERGWIKTRGKQRTDSTYVVAAIRRLYYLECVQQAMHHALNELSEVAPQWVQAWAPLAWYERYGPRADLFRLPKETSKRNALALVIGADGYELMDALWRDASVRALLALPAVEMLRQIWIQHYYRCTAPEREEIRWRDTADQPPTAQLIQSPYDLDARYGTKRDMNWVGYQVHLSETCDEDQPHLITQVTTTLATTSDFVMGEPIEQDLADRDLLPGSHLVDSGYVVAELLVTGPGKHQIDVVGPPLGSSSRQHRENLGYDLHAFVIDWEAQQAICPQGHRSVKWTPGPSPSGLPVMRIRFNKATCLACPMRSACTSSKEAARQITVKPQAQYEAIEAARRRQETEAYKALYALRAGVESTISQGVRRFDLRRSRYIGLARTHLQQTLNATAMNLVRIAAWLRNGRSTPPKRPPGHFARLTLAAAIGLVASGAGLG